MTAIDYWLYNIFGWCLLNGICSSNFYFGGCLNWHCNSINLLKLSGQLIADNAFNWNCPDKVLRKLSINWNCLHTRVYGVGFIYYSKLAATAATNTFVNRPKFVQHPMFMPFSDIHPEIWHACYKSPNPAFDDCFFVCFFVRYFNVSTHFWYIWVKDVCHAGLFFEVANRLFCFQVSFCPAKGGNRAGSSRNESDYSGRGTQTSFPLLESHSCEKFGLAHFSISC